MEPSRAPRWTRERQALLLTQRNARNRRYLRGRRFRQPRGSSRARGGELNGKGEYEHYDKDYVNGRRTLLMSSQIIGGELDIPNGQLLRG
jgi:hypothetical protein